MDLKGGLEFHFRFSPVRGAHGSTGPRLGFLVSHVNRSIFEKNLYFLFFFDVASALLSRGRADSRTRK